MAEQTAPAYVIIGNGIAGATAAEILRTEDSAATITVIADDPSPVYYRPALKDYLGGKVREDKLWARPTSFYQDRNIRFIPDRVAGIQAVQHTIQLQSGRQVGYNRLLLANGARPVRLNCPGLNLTGVYTLRTVADYQAVLENLNETRNVVVTGSGTLALETVETLRHRGYAVTHLIRRRILWSEVLDATASDLVLQQERRDGVDVRVEEEIAEIFGKNGLVGGVVTRSGEQISCETVIVAIGVDPIIDFIKSSGITCGRGVKVDPRMRTNALDIYAAGDVLETVNSLTGRPRIIGQWYPAIQQARAAAYSMLDLLDTDTPFNPNTFYNATFLYGLDFASVGVTNTPGYQEVVAEPKPRIYRKVLLKNGIPVGTLALGDRKQTLALKRAIDHRVNMQPILAALFADDFKLNDWLDRQGVPPPQMGINRQGDAKVKQAASALVTSKQQPVRSEASLVPVDKKDEAILETLLSQTKVITVGRQPGVNLLIDEATVSRRHAEISYANNQYVLRDLGSTNGTFINDARLESTSTSVLKANDIVRFGKVVKFSFVTRVFNEKAKVVNNVSMAGIAREEGEEEGDSSKMGQPIINPDGSLLLPGATTSLAAAVVATFKQSAALVVLSGSGTKEGKHPPMVFLLKEGKQTTLGREEGMDIVLANPEISRRHAELASGSDGFYIRDLGSSNGVIVNQAKITNPYHLSHGDRISLGGTMLYFIDLRVTPDTTAVRNAAAPRVENVIARNEYAQAGSYQDTQRAPVPVISGKLVEKKEVTRAAIVRSAGVANQSNVASPPQLRICNQCGRANTRTARFCASCSASLGSML